MDIVLRAAKWEQFDVETRHKFVFQFIKFFGVNTIIWIKIFQINQNTWPYQNILIVWTRIGFISTLISLNVQDLI
jgi:hypothetical protein